MRTIIFTLTIFISSFVFELPLKAERLETSSASSIMIGDKGVNKKSAKRFKSPKRAKRGKRTCLRKKGCSSGWAKSHAAATKKSKCKDKR